MSSSVLIRVFNSNTNLHMLTYRDQKIADELKAVTGRLAEDLMYQLVVDEIDRSDFDPVAKVLAMEEAEGDEAKANALYPKHRIRRVQDMMKAIALDAEAEQLKVEKDTRTKLKKEEWRKRKSSFGDFITSTVLLIFTLFFGVLTISFFYIGMVSYMHGDPEGVALIYFTLFLACLWQTYRMVIEFIERK